MKYLDEKLINARPVTETDNEQFVRQTIGAVQNAYSHATFESSLRTERSNENKENFIIKILAMSKVALVLLCGGAVLVTGGATYAVINWFGADVSTQQKANTIYSITANCAPSTLQALQGNKSHTNTAKYKILKPELISQEDLRLDELSTCEQRAIESELRSSMPDIYQPGDSKEGLYYPVGKYGTIVSATASEITVAQIPVDHQTDPREFITATLKVNSSTLVTNQGETVEPSSFKRGDSVYIIFQNPVRAGHNDNDWRATPSDKSILRSIAESQYDIKAIKEKVFKASAEGAFQIMEKSDGFGG